MFPHYSKTRQNTSFNCKRACILTVLLYTIIRICYNKNAIKMFLVSVQYTLRKQSYPGLYSITCILYNITWYNTALFARAGYQHEEIQGKCSGLLCHSFPSETFTSQARILNHTTSLIRLQEATCTVLRTESLNVPWLPDQDLSCSGFNKNKNKTFIC